MKVENGFERTSIGKIIFSRRASVVDLEDSQKVDGLLRIPSNNESEKVRTAEEKISKTW
jgi:hypothetical protein